MAHSHRSSRLKQQNKKHKAVGSTKASKVVSKGRVEGRKGPKAQKDHVKGKGVSAASARTDRLNAAKQTLKQRRQEVWLTKRLGSRDGAPKVVLLMGLSALADVAAVRSSILSQAHSVCEHDHGRAVSLCTAAFSQYKQRATLVSPTRSLTSCLEFSKVADFVLLVLPLQQGEDHCVDEIGEQMLNCLKAQGLPTVIGVTQGLAQLPNKKASGDMKKYGQRLFDTEFGDLAKIVDGDNAVHMVRVLATAPTRTIHWRAQRSYFLADTAFVNSPVEGELGSGGGDGQLRVRGYIRGRPLSVNQVVCVNGAGHFKMRVISSCAEPCPLRGVAASGGSSGIAKSSSNSNCIIEDDVQMMPPPSAPAAVSQLSKLSQLAVLAVADPRQQDSLQMEAEIDHLAGEQTWPTEEEMAMADEAAGGGGVSSLLGKKKGASTYQGAWSEALKEDHDDEEEKREHVMVDDDVKDSQAWLRDDEDGEDDGLGGDELEGEMEGTRVERRLQERAREDMDFPDEVDTPFDKPARVRFARFRHLKSFRTSTWDPKESLPRDYARIFQFENFAAVQKKMVAESEKVEKQQNEQLLSTTNSHSGSSSKAGSTRPSRSASVASFTAAGGRNEHDDDDDDNEGMEENDDIDMEDEDGSMSSSSAMGAASTATSVVNAVVHGAGMEGVVASGQYVEIVIEGVSADTLRRRKEAHGGCDWPILLFSLLRFENKLSVLHFNIQREPSLPEDTVIPSKEKLIFQVGFRRWTCRPIFSQISLNCDKHKYERFLQPGRFVGASCYGPATYQPAPLLVFRKMEDGTEQLVASGSLLSVDADRIILKKVILTGYPLRVKKRKGVVKYMFHNPEDIKWFKPCELVTKWGLTGSIREAVGTHGLLKAVFNKPIKQNDIVCLNLFKRIYPKFDDDTVIVS